MDISVSRDHNWAQSRSLFFGSSGGRSEEPFAIWYLWRILRRPIPEALVFAKPDLTYDTGVQPFSMSFGYQAQRDAWKRMFERRKTIQFTAKEVATLKLRDTETGNRLTIDHGAERVDVGRALTEVEREWLFNHLKYEYKV